ncbi:hypothetical protein C2G38_2156493 [Gigaspora rosea]|uniref:Uncharacterized protein n=1 Tax=Gigaspora rosea TaxID=44941 RepID=A0A397W2R4_9GLOM|nr:hypothetical protein C2G38_2156493 [Gigaspora rosea]
MLFIEICLGALFWELKSAVFPFNGLPDKAIIIEISHNRKETDDFVTNSIDNQRTRQHNTCLHYNDSVSSVNTYENSDLNVHLKEQYDLISEKNDELTSE